MAGRRIYWTTCWCPLPRAQLSDQPTRPYCLEEEGPDGGSMYALAGRYHRARGVGRRDSLMGALQRTARVCNSIHRRPNVTVPDRSSGQQSCPRRGARPRRRWCAHDCCARREHGITRLRRSPTSFARPCGIVSILLPRSSTSVNRRLVTLVVFWQAPGKRSSRAPIRPLCTW